jgi:stress response protein YsnF
VYETGRARLRKYVVTEDVQITVQVRREKLRVEHEPIRPNEQQLVEDPDVFGTLEEFGGPDGGIIYEVVLHEERPVISTEIVPVERVRLSKLVETEQHIASGQVLKEQIEVSVPGQQPTTLD